MLKKHLENLTDTDKWSFGDICDNTQFKIFSFYKLLSDSDVQSREKEN